MMNNTNSNYLRIYADCVPVLGKEKSALYNLSLGFIKLIPNSMYDLIKELQDYPIEDIKANYSHCIEIFDEYLAFLLNNNWAFITKTPNDFPEIESHYYSPSIISNAIIEYTAPDGYDAKTLFSNLDKMNCKQVELRFDSDNTTIEQINTILAYCEGTTIRFVTLLVRYNKQMFIQELELLVAKYPKLGQLLIYATDLPLQGFDNNRIIITNEDISQSLYHEAYPKQKYFVNMHFFYEALHANPYYNKKVAIDGDGNIKNCLLHPNCFGNINQDNLFDVISTASFQRLWKAKPDLIEEIKDSELRYCMLITDQLAETESGTFRRLSNCYNAC